MMQDKLKAIFLDLDSVNRNDLSLTQLQTVCSDWLLLPKVQGDLLEITAGAQVIVSNKVVLDRDVLRHLPELKLICVAATGTNNVDLTAARELGVDVCNVTGYATPSVVQYVFTVMLQLFSRIRQYESAVRRGDWSRSDMFCLLDYPFHELQGKVLGIYGYGELGQAVAQVATAFGMQVLIAARDENDTRPGRIQLPELLPQVDVLSLHCPLTDNTRDLISHRQLDLMKPGAILINSARGGVVNEAALINAMNSGHLGGAAMDVLTIEPPPEDHALLTFKHPNLIVTPHIAWGSVESRQRLLDQVAENIRCYFAGNARNIIN